MSQQAPNLKLDKFGIVLLTKPKLGPSGRFIFFFGQHYDGKELCFDVGAADMAMKPVEVVRRHHKDKTEALVTWEHICRRLPEIERSAEQAKDELEAKYKLFGPNNERIN